VLAYEVSIGGNFLDESSFADLLFYFVVFKEIKKAPCESELARALAPCESWLLLCKRAKAVCELSK
jgi:hypothetical protein